MGAADLRVVGREAFSRSATFVVRVGYLLQTSWVIVKGWWRWGGAGCFLQLPDLGVAYSLVRRLGQGH